MRCPLRRGGLAAGRGRRLLPFWGWGAATWVSALAIAVGASAAPGSTATYAATAASVAKCPLKSSSSIPPGDAWAFHDTAAPSSAHPGISSSYVHGRGDWGGNHGSGTICLQHSSSSGGSHELVLAVTGSARVYPGVTRLGHRGVQLALHMSVVMSDDLSCPVASHGSVTLFASYYEEHRDSLKLRFADNCATYADTFAGQMLSALIAEDGHQVN